MECKKCKKLLLTSNKCSYCGEPITPEPKKTVMTEGPQG